MSVRRASYAPWPVKIPCNRAIQRNGFCGAVTTRRRVNHLPKVLGRLAQIAASHWPRRGDWWLAKVGQGGPAERAQGHFCYCAQAPITKSSSRSLRPVVLVGVRLAHWLAPTVTVSLGHRLLLRVTAPASTRSKGPV